MMAVMRQIARNGGLTRPYATRIPPLMIVPDRINLDPSWKSALRDSFASPTTARLSRFLLAERAAGKTLYPAPDDWFRALNLTPLDQVRVVILGQDPYHGPGQAHGLAFSVCPGVRVPPSLANIFKELHSDLGITPSRHGCLEHWATQGVLLLNNVLTVEHGLAASHQGKGWEALTDAVVRLVNDRPDPVVFLLWGRHAERKAAFVDDVGRSGRHLVLRAPHPSPLSAHSGFLGCRHFSLTNNFLCSQGLPAIDWALPAA